MKDVTHISIKSGKSTGIASIATGANLNGIAFNIDFIASKNPTIAVDVMELFEKANAIKEDTPKSPIEDYDLALEKLKDIFKD